MSCFAVIDTETNWADQVIVFIVYGVDYQGI